MAEHPGPLGWLAPEVRTPEQRAAHERALAAMPKFALAPVAVPVGTKIILTDFWKTPEFQADVGFAFTGFRQRSGACVGVSEGDAIATLAAVQRMNPTAPTKAFVPFWPFNYGRCRWLEGDRGRGEGAVDSVMGTQATTEGHISITEAGLPSFDFSDGLALPESTEMQWSDGAAAVVTKWLETAKPHTVGTRATLESVDQIQAAIVNGYPVLDGCSNYVGNGKIVGSGDTAYVQGHYDGRGGHSTCILGFFSHPTDGPLYLYSNQWSGSTYPKDPAGAGRCCVWLKEAELAKLFRNGGGNGETMALSHLNYFPSQDLLNWLEL